MTRRFLVTAALPYSNNRLHVGHIAGAYLPADIYVRYLRACGHDVRFICGSDDNGVAIEISALREKTTPAAIANHYHDRQEQDFAGLNIAFDIYGGTHHPDFVELHERFSQEFFNRIFEQGYFTKRTSKQLYDPQAERFLPDRFVRGTCHHCGFERATGDQCENCGQMIEPLLLKSPKSVITGQDAVVKETTHWYLQLNSFARPLQEWLESKQGQWRPSVLNFALGQIKQGLPERSMTRDISWGVPVPLDDEDAQGKVLYVWFDAPIGYMSFTAKYCAEHEGGWENYAKWWSDPDTAIVHFIGEDNTVFHALTWPAMLMADERHQLPHAVVANNFMNQRIHVDGAAEPQTVKISKSSTPQEAPVWIEEYVKKGLDPDALRFYLTAQAPESARTAFDPEEFVTRNNSELVAAFGNFVNRALTFAAKYCDGQVPDAAAQTDADRAHIAAGAAALEKVGQHLDAHRFRGGLEEMMAYARQCNEYFSTRAPWASRKTDMADCAATIATCIHAVHILATLAGPFMPAAAARIEQMLGQAQQPLRWEVPPPPQTGAALGEPAILFEKLEPGALATGDQA
jgi:methionyl-tRNA synthetase